MLHTRLIRAAIAALVVMGTLASTLAPRPVSGRAALSARAARIQSTVTLTAVADATLKSWQPDANFGSEQTLEIGHSEIDGPQSTAILLRFDVSSLPANAIIDSASLELYLESSSGLDPVGLGIYYVNDAWTEAGVTWNTAPTVATTGLNWQVDSALGYKSHGGLGSWVSAWMAGANNGVMVYGPLSGDFYQRIFKSREAASNMPRLVVTYHLPAVTFSGYVYAGDVGNESVPLSGVTVELYCSNNAGEVGARLTGATTGLTGWYELSTPETCEFYNILETDLADYASAGATTIGGTVINDNWIQYAFPLDGKSLDGNKFWDSPTTPLQITSGPSAINIGLDSATITWGTNHASDSAVWYGSNANGYAAQQTDATLVTSHSVTLLALTPSTPYHFVVMSADAGGSVITGTDRIFTTLPASDDTDPTATILAPETISGTSIIRAAASDNVGVAKVEFYLDDQLVFTSFSPPYQFSLDSRSYTNQSYEIKAKAIDLSGRSYLAHRPTNIFNIIDATAPQVTILAPTASTVSGTVSVVASLSDDTGLALAQVLVDGAPVKTVTYPAHPLNATLTADVDTQGLGLSNANHRITVKAYDFDPVYLLGKIGTDYVDVTVYNPPPLPQPPKLIVASHVATRTQNSFVVGLTVKNVGGQEARNIVIRDWLQAFLPISRTTPTASYQFIWLGQSIMQISSTVNLAPLQSVAFTFSAAPILEYPDPPTPEIGQLVQLGYDGPDGIKYDDGVNAAIAQTVDGNTLPQAHANAVKAADYVLITDPVRLIMFGSPPASVNTLLSEMAQMAIYEQGVLGYFYDYNAVKLRKLLAPNLFYLIEMGDNWALRLHSDFSQPAGGYVLLVGETSIIPTWKIPMPDGPIHHSDQPYSDTSGNDDRPELAVGRIIGNDAARLSKVIRTSIGIHEGLPGYGFDRSDALVVSGGGEGTYLWADGANQVAGILDDQFSVDKLLCTDHFAISSFNAVFSQDDGFAVGDVIGDAKSEVVIGDANTSRIYVYDANGTKLQDFDCGYGTKHFEAGDKLALGSKSIVMADASTDRILYYNAYGISQSSFSLDFEAGDGLAVGDVAGDNYKDIVVADASADKIYVYSVNGVKLAEFSATYATHYGFGVGNVLGYIKDQILIANDESGMIDVYDSAGTKRDSFDGDFTENDGLAVNDVWGDDKAEILVAGDVTGRVDIFSYAMPEFALAYFYKAGFTVNDGFAVGDVVGDGKGEILIADDVAGTINLSSPRCGERLPDLFKSKAQNKDVIFFEDHGTPYSWEDVINTWDSKHFPISFDNSNPFLFASACATANYEPADYDGVTDAFFDSGAAAYIGSTVVYAGGKDAQEMFFQKWVNTPKSIGRAFIETEKQVVEKLGDIAWVREFNLYGDPKLGMLPSASFSSNQNSSAKAPSSLDVVVPDYVVTTQDGQDYVNIAGGMGLMIEGKPQVPFYSVQLDYPKGNEVQDVSLIARSGLIMTTGLKIPNVRLIVKNQPEQEQRSAVETGWYPEMEYDWRALKNSDGTTTLTILMYPFYYNAQTTDVRFYKNYSFAVHYVTSTVIITGTGTDKYAYQPGEPVKIDLAIDNSGAARDVVVSTVIRQYGSGDTVDGLPLAMLTGLNGQASFVPQWNSSGFEPGQYLTEVTLKDASSYILDRRIEMFRLGSVSGQVTSISAVPDRFNVGDQVSLSLIFSNTGTTHLTGTAVIRVQSGSGAVVQKFKHIIANLSPGSATTVNDTWNTTGASIGAYTVLGYVAYDSMVTEPQVLTLRAGSCVYLPLVLQSSP